MQELEKLRLQNKDLKSKRKSLLTNRDQSLEPTKRLEALIQKIEIGEIEMKTGAIDLNITEKEINELKEIRRDLERKIDLSIATGPVVKKLNKELEDFEAKYKGRMFNVDTIVNTNFIEKIENPKSFNLNELSSNIKFLNTGRSTSPNQLESPGAFYENLPVGKFGGMLAEVIYSQ